MSFLLRNSAVNGGWGGIRTHGALARTPVFKTGALNRSAIPPSFDFVSFFGLLASTEKAAATILLPNEL
jgi:hypothetical protein